MEIGDVFRGLFRRGKKPDVGQILDERETTNTEGQFDQDEPDPVLNSGSDLLRYYNGKVYPSIPISGKESQKPDKDKVL